MLKALAPELQGLDVQLRKLSLQVEDLKSGLCFASQAVHPGQGRAPDVKQKGLTAPSAKELDPKQIQTGAGHMYGSSGPRRVPRVGAGPVGQGDRQAEPGSTCLNRTHKGCFVYDASCRRW